MRYGIQIGNHLASGLSLGYAMRPRALALAALVIVLAAPVVSASWEGPWLVPHPGSYESFTTMSSPDGRVTAVLHQVVTLEKGGKCHGWSSVGASRPLLGVGVVIKSVDVPHSCEQRLVSVTWVPIQNEDPDYHWSADSHAAPAPRAPRFADVGLFRP